jgi:hypothetical protein
LRDTSLGQSSFEGVSNGAASLFYAGSPKLATTSTGVDITGTITSDGLTLEGASAGLANFYRASANANFGAITFKDTTNTTTNAQIGWNANELRLDGTNTIRQVTGGLSRMLIASNGDITFYDTSGNPSFVYDENAGSTFNEQGENKDFRVESDANANALFVDAQNSRVGINEGTPLANLHITSPTASIKLQATDNYSYIEGKDTTATDGDAVMRMFGYSNADFMGSVDIRRVDGTNGEIVIRQKINNVNTDTIFFSSSEVAFNEGGNDIDFRVESDGYTHMLFVDASGNVIGVNNDTPDSAFSIDCVGDARFAVGGYTPSGVTDDYTQGVVVTGSNQRMNIGINAETNGGGYIQMRHSSTGFPEAYYQLQLNPLGGPVIVNDGSNNNGDFRVESDTNANMLFVDAGSNQVKVGGTATGFSKSLIVNQDSSSTSVQTGIEVRNSDLTTGSQTGIVFTNYDNMGAKISSLRTGSSAGHLQFWINSGGGTSEVNLVNALQITTADTVFNEIGWDRDFRVESDTNTHALFVDASKNAVGINTPENLGSGLHVVGTTNSEYRTLFVSEPGDVTKGVAIAFDGTNNRGVITAVDAGTGWLPLYVENTSLTVDKGLVVNEGGGDSDFRVESDSQSNMLFVDAGSDMVYVGGSSSRAEQGLVVRAPMADVTTDGFPQKASLTLQPSTSVNNNGATALFLANSTVDTGSYGFSMVCRRTTITGANAELHFNYHNNSSGGTQEMRITSSGVVIAGSLSKGSGSFRIDHPLPEKSATHDLVHSFVESPQADNIYRGKIDLVAGQASVNIDTVAGMTEGTFAALNREVQCFTSNETGWTAVRGSVSGNILTIEAQDSTCTDTVSWLVIGERQDQHMYDTDWTDDNGKVIVEPLKDNPQP